MERLTAEDRLMLWPDERWPQDIGALAILDGASNCRWVNPRVGDSEGTEGRRTCSAGECSSRPSKTQVR
jgi:hypothetical protein